MGWQDGQVGLNEVWSGALMSHCYIQAAESDCAINQKSGLKSMAHDFFLLFKGHIIQIVRCVRLNERLIYTYVIIRE